MSTNHLSAGAKSGPRRFSPGAIDYDGAMSVNYSAGRALSPETAKTWCSIVEPFVGTSRPAVILDLGAGTGRFAKLFVESFAARVIAVEPSRGMLAAAVIYGRLPRVAHVVGTAENLPLRDHSCDVAWLSQVFHHIRDHRACAGELRRVLRGAGRVLVRGTFGDRLDGFPTLLRFFPSTRFICEGLPTVEETRKAFAAEGFIVEADRRVQQKTCGSLREFAERTRLRADSALALIPDEEFAQGVARLEVAAMLEDEPCAVVETLDLLVFKAAG
jgi:ubiquinone/menaquinone biosynthesis C-methylase UbiE